MHTKFRKYLSNTKRLLAMIMLTPTFTSYTQAKTVDLSNATIDDINAAFDAGTLTSEELVTRYLARIEAYDQKGPSLKAIIAIADNAIERARALDKERVEKGPRSPLHGIPFVAKDTVDTIDAPTAGGCIGLANTYPLDDSTVVRKLKDAGGILLAKGNLDEFNRGSEGLSSLGGQVLNPYDLTRNPGGSSAGPGVAVNCGFATLGIATETGASIRSPASNNSLVGFAPTQGLISRAGLIAISYTQDRAGSHAKTVKDAAIMANYMRGFDAEDLFTHSQLGRVSDSPYSDYLDLDGLKGARIGVFRDLFRKGEEFQEINNMIDLEIEKIYEQGALVIDGLSIGMDIVKFFPLARASNFEFYEAYRAYIASRGDTVPYKSLEALQESGEILERMGPRYLDSIELGNTEFNDEYIARLKNRKTLRSMIVELMDEHQVDALVHPFKSLTAPPLGTGDRGPRDNPVSSVTGLPALVIPAGFNSEGLPISIEFLGRPFSEPTLFKLAYAYEQSTQHRIAPDSTPPLPGEEISY